MHFDTLKELHNSFEIIIDNLTRVCYDEIIKDYKRILTV